MTARDVVAPTLVVASAIVSPGTAALLTAAGAAAVVAVIVRAFRRLSRTAFAAAFAVASWSAVSLPLHAAEKATSASMQAAK
jgi:hypothetical protein